MDELTYQELIKAKYTGELDQMFKYVSLSIQALSVLIGGFVLWRASNAYHSKKQNERMSTNFFENRYSKHWKNR
jgi:hypothetical protein